MICGFKQKFPWGEPTYFREKIWACVGYRDLGAIDKKSNPMPYLFVPGLNQKQHYTNYHPKIHTIREDPHNRWKVDNSIQMAYGVRTKNYCQFNKGIPELEKCVSVQTIVIKWTVWNIEQAPLYQKDEFMKVEIDGKVCTDVNQLAINDGFSGIEEFMNWFSKDFKGKIIHWSNHKY